MEVIDRNAIAGDILRHKRTGQVHTGENKVFAYPRPS